ncbi:MAG: hypothetical protein HOJ07_07995 [Rhodospirillaceae bacterium]|nr:hypothetical protein [Rhodospirillaceae bacterium]
MADKNQPPWQNGSEIDADGDAPTESRRFGEGRRRLPLAAFVVLLALIGVGVYVAWPAIQDSVQSPPLERVAENTAKIDSAPVPLPPVAEPPASAPPAEPSATMQALIAQVAVLETALAERAEIPPPEPAAEPNLTPLTDALSEAMARVEALEQALAEAQSPARERPQAVAAGPRTATSADDFRTLERLDTLEDKLNASTAQGTSVTRRELESLRAGQTALQEQLAATRQLIESFDQREAGDGRTMMLILSHSRLTRAAATAQPFAREVEAFRAAVQSEGGSNLALENAIRDLAVHALQGAPTTAALAAGFDDMALGVVHADAAAEDQGWVDATIGRLRRIVTVRRVGGEIAADSLEGRLSAVHAALQSGELASAISVAEALPAKARSGAENWLQGARARRAVESALAVLDTEISERVAARWSSAESANQ